eukprot:5154270-Amphidinium_carterae.2
MDMFRSALNHFDLALGSNFRRLGGHASWYHMEALSRALNAASWVLRLFVHFDYALNLCTLHWTSSCEAARVRLLCSWPSRVTLVPQTKTISLKRLAELPSTAKRKSMNIE